MNIEKILIMGLAFINISWLENYSLYLLVMGHLWREDSCEDLISVLGAVIQNLQYEHIEIKKRGAD